MNRQKSISSQTASISAWYTDLDWPSMVAAAIFSRHGPANRSAARRNTAARSSNGSAAQSLLADMAASTAAAASAWVALVSAQPGGVPVRLHDVDSLAVAHPVSAADDVRQVDGVIGQEASSVRSRVRSGDFGA